MGDNALNWITFIVKLLPWWFAAAASTLNSMSDKRSLLAIILFNLNGVRRSTALFRYMLSSLKFAPAAVCGPDSIIILSAVVAN